MKKLYLFMLQRFLPLFVMTFLICIFIILMEFLWKYIDDLVGKGLGVDMLAQLFFYAALSMVPMALPLSLLLASLMTFGNLGEHFELTAMKSAGISLVKVMRPLIVLVVIVSVGAFYFQNEVLPKTQVKMWTLMFSMRQKSPELDIPEKTFYHGIEGYNLFVKKKNSETGTLHNVMIYDVSKGYGYANVILADSGRLSFTKDKKNLYLQLYSGESFEDLQETSTMSRSKSGMLYRRETFHDKNILIPFDANFNVSGEDMMRSQYIGKNLTELNQTVDSINARLDSIGGVYSNDIRLNNICGTPSVKYEKKGDKKKIVFVEPVKMAKSINFDSIFNSQSIDSKRMLVETAYNNAMRVQQEYGFKGAEFETDTINIRRHQIEMMRKFTLSLACLIFFFIGAPLGAIIRKGGLGTPIVISVLLFVVYYIIDGFGYKLARDGHVAVWEGMWLSSAVLMPLGVFLTIKSVNDSAVFNPDSYLNLLKRIMRKRIIRTVELKEFIPEEVDVQVALEKTTALKQLIGEWLVANKKMPTLFSYFKNYRKFDAEREHLVAELEDLVAYMSNSRHKKVLYVVSEFPIISTSLINKYVKWDIVWKIIAWVFPISVVIYLNGKRTHKEILHGLKMSTAVCDNLTEVLLKL